MPVTEKVLWIGVAMLVAFLACKATQRFCSPWACDLCAAITGEYRDLKDKLPDELPELAL